MDPLLLAIALIRKIDVDSESQRTTRWLARQSPVTGKLRFVVGYPENRGLMRENLMEEIGWEFGLDPKIDFVISKMAQLNYEFPDSLPIIADQVPLVVAFYNVEMYGKRARGIIDEDTQNVWLTSEEIWQAKSESGLALDPLVHQLITTSQVIRSWESSM